LWIFPEGTRHKTRDLNFLPFKKGAFHIALDNKMDILPVVFSQFDFYSHDEQFFESGEATIRIMKPISVEGYTKASMDDLVKDVRDKMYEAFLEMSTNGKVVKKNE